MLLGLLRRGGRVSPVPLLGCWSRSSGSSMSERESKLMGGYSRVCGIQAFFRYVWSGVSLVRRGC